MGVETFETVATGATAREAFYAARAEAQHEHGHGGYTGTIAEKGSFVTLTPPEGEKPLDFARRLINEADERIDNKWGPAGCVKLGDGKWLFFGWASS